jgi:predicted AlkP superfamily phosphohydrolase/phosphomutase
MKICVLGLDCAAPEIILRDDRLVNIRRLMDLGVYGRLESVTPPITVPAWMCMATSQDPGSLGIYGFRNRTGYSYDEMAFVNSQSIKEWAIWDQLARVGKRSILVGVPPGFPPRQINGISIGCFLTPNTQTCEFTYPPGIKAELNKIVGEYPVDVKDFRTDDKKRLQREIFEMSRKQWKAVRWLLSEFEWDYFQFVDIGLDRVHHGFWNFFDKQHIHYVPGNPYEQVIPDYYLRLDEEIGSVLELLDEDTIVLLVSDHGAQRLDGGFAVNEWLVREGLLVLDSYPDKVTPFKQLNVNWKRTKVWSEGGYYARVFFNVKGREPSGIVNSGEYEAFLAEMKNRFEALQDDKGLPLQSRVVDPRQIYRSTRNVPPDLIVFFGNLGWRSVGSVGHSQLHMHDNDTGPDGCNHAQFGMFILASPNCPLRGEYQGAGLLDIAPTLLELGGFEIPASMQGKSLVSDRPAGATGQNTSNPEHETTVRDRLEGLGYI